MRVLGHPAWANASRNPYNALLASGLVRLGCEVTDLTLSRALFGRADIVHLHWPQAVLNEPAHRAVRRALLLLLMLVAQRLRGAEIVWTVHNVHSHERRLPRAERLFMGLIARLLTSLIFLNPHSRMELEEEYPRTRRLRSSLIPHGLYEDAYPPMPDRTAARARFGLEQDATVVGLVGSLKAYKGIERFVESLASLPPGKITGFIAGGFADCAYGDLVRSAVDRAERSGRTIRLVEGHLNETDLVAALSACDVLALPYSSESNSGLAILAAERGVPMLLADTKPLRELVAEIGVAATRTSRSFAAADLLTVARDARAGGRAMPSPHFLEARRQAVVAFKTHAFFAQITGTGAWCEEPRAGTASEDRAQALA